MSPFRGLTRAWRFAVRKILGLWVKVTIKPEEIAQSIAARGRPVCYVLENESRTDYAVLDNACAALGIPKADRCFALVRQGAFLGARLRRRAPRQLVQLVEFASREPTLDVDLIPVAIYLGRAPEKEQSLWRLVFTEEWVLLGRFRKLLNVLFNGRNTVVYFGEPIALREVLADLPPQRGVRRALRALRAEFRAQRASTIGPDLSHRRTMVAHILRTQAVRHAVRAEMNARLAKGAHAARACAHTSAEAGAAPGGTAHRAQVRDGDRGQLFANLPHHHGLRPGAGVDASIRRGGVRARGEAARRRRRRRDHLRAVPPQPHGLSAALLRHIPQGASPCRTWPPG